MFIKFETAPFIQSYRSSHLVFVVFTKLCKEPLFSASERRLLTVSDYTPQKNEAEVLQQHSCRVICLFRSSTAVQPWLHLHSSFSPLSTSRSTHPYNDYSHHVKKQQDTPSLIRNLVFCSALRDAFASLVAILHSDPPSPSASLHWVVLIPHYVQFHICHRSRGSYAVVALGHTQMLKCSSSRQVFPIPERPVVYLRCCF